LNKKMEFDLKIGKKNYKIKISEKEKSIIIKINENEFYFPKKNAERKNFSFSKIEKKDFSQKEIRAPISGIISEVFIKEGQTIRKGEKLFTLSAMKMENEIVSEFDGRVEKILVKEGERVETNQKLMVLK